MSIAIVVLLVYVCHLLRMVCYNQKAIAKVLTDPKKYTVR